MKVTQNFIQCLKPNCITEKSTERDLHFRNIQKDQ